MFYFRKQDICNKEGVVLITSLLVLALLTVLATTTTMLTTTALNESKEYETKQDALFAAEAGIDYGRNALLLAIRQSDKAWIDMLNDCTDITKYPTYANCTGQQLSVILYEVKSDGTWDSTLPDASAVTNKYVNGTSGSKFSLTIKDNNDEDSDYSADSDFIVILQSTGTSGSVSYSKILEVTVSCPTCEDYYSQERYSPENPGSISTQIGAVDQTLQTGIDVTQ